MTETPYALAHGFALMVPAPDGVDAAIAEVMARHEAELDEALAPFGVALVDLLQPTWMRAVRVGDVEPLRSPGESLVDALVDEMSRPLLPLAGDRAAGGCCGPGEACSSAACSAFDEPRTDAAVFGAPRRAARAPMYGGADEDGF